MNKKEMIFLKVFTSVLVHLFITPLQNVTLEFSVFHLHTAHLIKQTQLVIVRSLTIKERITI